MTDEALRELERRWRAAGCADVGLEVALLAARRRAGALGPERLEAAACLGSAAARSLLDALPGADPELVWWLGVHRRSGEAARFSQAVDRAGPDAALRFAIALARAHLDTDDPDDRGAPPGALAAVESAEAGALAGASWSALEATRPPADCPWVVQHLLWPTRFDPTPALARRPDRAFWSITCSAAHARATLLREVVPWLLGHDDPLRARVQASRSRT